MNKALGLSVSLLVLAACESSSDAFNDYPDKEVPADLAFLVTAFPVEIIEFPAGCTVSAAGSEYALQSAERLRFRAGDLNPLNLPDTEVVVAFDYFRDLQVEQAVSFSSRALTHFAPSRTAGALGEDPVTWDELRFSEACGPTPVDIIPAYESSNLLDARIFLDADTACFSDELRSGTPAQFTGADFCITRDEFDAAANQ